MSKNKIVLITGGSRGLGKNMVQAVAAKGLDVIFTYNSKKDEAEALIKEVNALGRKAAALQLNVGESASFDAFWGDVKTVLKETFNTDKIDFLVNNAGVGLHNSFEETTEEQF